jgi:acetolactate synthase-1/2/3 large subunit
MDSGKGAFSMPKMTGARWLAETLAACGVTHVFHVPAILSPALAEMAEGDVRPVLTHSEKAAAYMADGYARASHRPGICMAQSVGAANLAAGLQDARLGLSPVIAITSRRPPLLRYRNSYQEIDHAPLFAPVTKFSATVNRVEEFPPLLRQAFREATSGAPGPVHLDVESRSGHVDMNTEAELEVCVEQQFTRYPAFRPEPEPKAAQRAAQALSQARRPVIVAGGGVTASQAQAEVVALAELLSIPVATSLNAKGAIPEDHPLSIGVVGSYSRWCTNQLVSKADLVLYIGSHTGSQVTNEWRVPPAGTPIVQIDIDARELGRNFPAKVALLGDARVTLDRLLRAVESRKQNVEWLQQVNQLVGEWRSENNALRHSEATPIRPERICQELTDFLPSDALLVSCTGHSGIWTGTMVELRAPGQSFIRAAGSLGWAFPAAMGAKCALPDRPVICFTGDGGLWYHIEALETAVRYGINTVTVVNNNHSLNQVAPAYVDMPNTDPLWQFSDVNFARIARAMGGFGVRVKEPGELRAALEQALASDRPALVDVVSDMSAIAPRAWSG